MKGSSTVHRFIDKTYLDKIISGVFIIIVLFTVLMYFYGPSYGLFDDFYFVVVTLTTVGYGDVTPHTHNEKVIAIFLIIIGVFVFSTITAAISSYLTDRLLDDEEKDIYNIVEENVRPISNELAEITNDRFNSIVDESHEIFYRRADIISTLIASSTEYSERVEDEIQSNVLVLKEINGKLDAFSDEILVNISETKSDDIKDLLEEIDRLTDSVSDYN